MVKQCCTITTTLFIALDIPLNNTAFITHSNVDIIANAAIDDGGPL